MDFSKRYQKAEEAYKKRNYDYAVEIYLSVLQMDPNQVKARNSLRAILVKKKEEGTYKGIGKMGQMGFAAKLKTTQVKKAWDQVIADCDRQLTVDMDNTGVMKSLGVALMHSEHHEAAVSVLETVRQITPKDVEVYRSLGTIFQHTGELDKAKKFWEVALQLAPTDAIAVRNVRDLNAQITSKVWEGDGTDDYRSKLRDQKMSAALEEQAHMIRTEEDIQKALVRADELLEEGEGELRDNDLAKIWRKKAELLERLRRYDDAREAYEQQLKFDPDSYDAPDKIGDLSLKAIEEKLMASKEDGTTQAEIERLTTELGKRQIAEYARRVKAHPTELKHRFDLGRACMKAGDFDQAIENLQQSVNDGKLEANSLLLLAQAFKRKGLFDFAKGQCKRILDGTKGQKNDLWKAATYTLADICEAADDVDEALGNFEQLYLIDISYRDVGKRYESLRKKKDGA